ncbi:LacI family DNA-binding transcriptional regulator [Parapedobacter sp. 10938]|uniref:LacI family DNA-binding transcriptional regulator n=1 Tax=Parapedobacter flavus TaxID=3110225 RepID=UPI002DBA476B|nr:LacI family DNA-binding transcriptional regulator [Parapedobacter sp. 10938]MEC3878113.1 LacI family DNA-binding transcriptional regulator [Parapedobacter sp. 10938]
MKRIATELGVSVALVSYVLNGKMTDRINEDTAERIRTLAKKLNYRPNQIAKSLKNSKTYTMGLIVADISNFFYSHLARYIEEEANTHGYNLIFGSAYEDPKRFENILHIFIARQVDGLILAIPEGAEHCIPYLKEVEVPFVLIDREFPQFEGITTINLDNFKSSERVVDHFLSQGFKRLGAIGLSTHLHHLLERRRGFMETALTRLSGDAVFAYEIVENRLTEEIENVVIAAIERDKVDALCFFTNKIAMAALPVIVKLNLRVPEDIAIVCYDEAGAYKLFHRPLSYVRQPLESMGSSAVNCLIGNGEGVIGNHIKFDSDLIINESSLLTSRNALKGG